jgi:hypothetical protein
MSEDISAALRRMVRLRARGQCEYCFMPDEEPTFPHDADHIIALKHGGPTIAENLAYSCFDCNRAKGSDIASLDPIQVSLLRCFIREHMFGATTFDSMSQPSKDSPPLAVSPSSCCV